MPAPEQRSVSFAPDVRVLAGVRDFAVRAAGDLHADVDRDLVAVVVGELAANAAVHQDGQAELVVSRSDDGGLEVAVVDPDPVVPEVVHSSPTDVHGHRGLQMVAALSEVWGVEDLHGAKRVWARLPPLGRHGRRSELEHSTPA